MIVAGGGGDEVAGIVMPPGDPGAVSEAADSLRQAGHAFGSSAQTIGRAMSEVPSWAGLASITYRDLCLTQKGTADQAGQAALGAATVVEAYAQTLADVKRKIGHLQDEAARQLARKLTAQTDAEEAAGRAQAAYEMAHVVGSDPTPGSQSAAADLRDQGQRAAEESAQHAAVADKAEKALVALRGKAERLRKHLENEGDSAATQVAGYVGSLPTVSWPGQPTAGDTVTNSWEYADEAAVTVFFVKLQNGQDAILARHGDGTWTVEVGDSLGVGLSGTLGEKLQVGSKGGVKEGGVSRDLEGSIMAQGGHGMTFKFGNRDDAIDFLNDANDPLDDGWTSFARVAGGPIVNWIMGPESPDDDRSPIERYSEGGVALSGSATVSGAGGLSANAEAGLEEALGTRTDTATGDETTYYSTKASAGGSLEALSMGASGSAEGSSVTSVTRSPDHEITKLSITSTTATSTSVDFKPDIKDLAGLGHQVESASASASTGAGTRTETTVTLNVTPADRPLVERYLHSGGTDSATTHAVLDRLNHAGQLDVRVYDTNSSSTGVEASAEGFGVEGSHTETVSTLRDAWTRPPGDTVLHHLRLHG